MRADMRRVFHETGRLWPVTDAHGDTVLFNSQNTAELYAAEHGVAVGAPMATMKATVLWATARMTLAADGKSYEVEELPDVERRSDARRPNARMRRQFVMDVLAHTSEEALALAGRAGRAAVKMTEKGLAPELAVGRLVYRDRRWMEEDL